MPTLVAINRSDFGMLVFKRQASGSPGSLEEPIPGGGDPEFQASKHNGPGSKPSAPSNKGQAPNLLDEFDEYGTELHKDARVWKVYVNEADKHDAELVNGWNESTDVILIFAALFSAISTAFLIESSKLLQSDPAEESARSLLIISLTLSAIADGTQSAGPVPLTSSGPAEFTPSRAAVCVNVLWYLSLGLSLATSFIAILAKDWCSSFMRGRTGHPYSQMCRRQQKWDMIVKWKMSELLTILPSLIHLALLLFSVGLCIYLSHVHAVVAIPIFCATGAAIGFYIWSSVAAISIDYFPYPTIISRVCPTEVARHAAQAAFALAFRFASHPAIRYLYQMALMVVFASVWVLGILLYIPGLPFALIYALESPLDKCDAYLTRSPPLLQLVAIPLSRCFRYLIWYPGYVTRELVRELHYYLESAEDSLEDRLSDASWGLEWTEWDPKAADQADGDENEQIDVTSLALSWLITNCEAPQSVDIALQSIAGATSRTPRQPLLDCHATLEILRRLASSNLYKGPDARTDTIVSLYSRALTRLGGTTGSGPGTERSGRVSDLEGMIWDVHQESEKAVAALIVSGSFDPTQANLHALRIGNTAASISLKLLGRDSQNTNVDIDQTLGSIFNRFESHVKGSEPLHDAALVSLVAACALLLPFGLRTSTAKSLIPLCMKAIGPHFIALRPGNTLLANLAITCACIPSQPMDSEPLGSLISRPLLRDVVGRLVECYTEETTTLRIGNVTKPVIRATCTEVAQLTRFDIDIQDTLLSLAASGVDALYCSLARSWEGAGVKPSANGALELFGAIKSPLGLELVASPSSSIPFLILLPIGDIWWSPGAPAQSQWEKIACDSCFPTLSSTLVCLVEQSNLISHLEKIIKGDTYIRRFIALGQLWLLFTAYLGPSIRLTDERERLGIQLRRYDQSHPKSEHIQHADIGHELVLTWESENLHSNCLNGWLARLMECVYQSRNSPVPKRVSSVLQDRGIPEDLRGLSSFTSWRPPPNKIEAGDTLQSTNDAHAEAYDEKLSQNDQPIRDTSRGRARDEVNDTGSGAARLTSLDNDRGAVCEGRGSENRGYGTTDSGKMTKSEGDVTIPGGQRVGDARSTTSHPMIAPGDAGNGTDGEPHISIDVHASDEVSR